LAFKLSEKYYGIDTARVYGVIEADDIFFLPGRSGFVKGVISLRGQLVTVLDSAVLSGNPCGRGKRRAKIVVIKIEEQLLGIDIRGAEVFFVWGKKSGVHADKEDMPDNGPHGPSLTEQIVDVPCESILTLARKILAPGRRKVLIADDMSFFRSAIKEALTSGGFEVVAEACNGQEAIELTKKLQPEIVILDMVMPVKNGLEAAEVIMALPHSPRVVICSSLNDEGIIRDAREAGVDAYITKPFTSAEALTAVLDIA